MSRTIDIEKMATEFMRLNTHLKKALVEKNWLKCIDNNSMTILNEVKIQLV